MIERCGACGGGLVARATDYGAEEGAPTHYIWMHMEAGVDHEPVLGTPVPEEQRLFAATRKVEAAEAAEEEPEPIPAPEVRSRPAKPAETPPAAARMAALATKHGWTTSVRYSKGPLLDATASRILSRDCQAIVVKGSKPDVGIFDATWLYRPEATTPKWAFDTAWVSTADAPGFRTMDSPTLKALIKETVL